MRRSLILIPAVVAATAGFLARDRVAKLATEAAKAAKRKVQEATAQEGSITMHTAADWFGAAAKERYGDADADEPERKE